MTSGRLNFLSSTQLIINIVCKLDLLLIDTPSCKGKNILLQEQMLFLKSVFIEKATLVIVYIFALILASVLVLLCLFDFLYSYWPKQT